MSRLVWTMVRLVGGEVVLVCGDEDDGTKAEKVGMRGRDSKEVRSN